MPRKSEVGKELFPGTNRDRGKPKWGRRDGSVVAALAAPAEDPRVVPSAQEAQNGLELQFQGI